MKRLGEYLLVLGIPGIFLVAFLDSAAVPMVGGPDAVVLLLAWQKPTHTPWIALAAASGSLLGCLVLYKIGQTGRDLVTRGKPRKDSWVLRQMDRNAVAALLLATLAPPPFPTKAAVLAAGVMRLGLARFITGILSGRLVRYSTVAFVGARFGDQGMEILKRHYPAVGLAVVAGLVLILVMSWMRKNRQGGDDPGAPDESAQP
jgi:membrane protein YqaA with SNARE-associated domain